MTRRYRVMFNPAAGEKAGIFTNSTDEAALRKLMLDHGLGDDLSMSDDEAGARTQVKEAIDAGIEIIVAAGGDGTAGMIAQEILGTSSALGILPLGSAMNIARSLGISRDLEEAAAILASGEVIAVDVGQAGGGIFLEAASVGINARIFKHAQRLADGDDGSIREMLHAIVRHRATRMTIELDDRTIRTGALMVTIANGPYSGMGLTVAPDARLDDGLFDVAVFRRFSKWELLRHMASIVAGRRQYHPKVTTYRSARVRISARRPLPARADSRDLGWTPFEARVAPGTLHVLIAARRDRLPLEEGGPALTQGTQQ